MNRYTVRLLSAFLLTFLFACDKNKQSDATPDDGGLSFAFYAEDARVYYLHDAPKHRIYAIEAIAKGKVISYNYVEKKVLGSFDKHLQETFSSWEAAVGHRPDGTSEVYIADNKSIHTYNADFFFRIDSVKLPDSIDISRISTIDMLQDSILFYGSCGPAQWPSFPRVRMMNRYSKRFLPYRHRADQCAYVRTFTSTQNGQKIYNAVSMNFTNIPPRVSLEKFDASGKLLSAEWREYQDAPYGIRPLSVGNDAPYFVLGVDGQVYSTQDLSLLGTLGELYYDHVIADKGQTIYAITDSSGIDVFTYPGLKKVKTIPPPAKGLIQQGLFPTRLYLDGNKLLIVYSKRSGPRSGTYIALIDL